jgi:hypothetical protein
MNTKSAPTIYSEGQEEVIAMVETDASARLESENAPKIE